MPYRNSDERKVYDQRRYKDNREAELERARKYREANHEKVKAGLRKDYADNREKRLAAKRAHYLANKEIYRERSRAYRQRNAERLNANSAEYRAKNRTALLSKAMFARSGFSLEYKQQIMAEQQGLCAICAVDLSTLPSKEVHADHCHNSMKPRGVLCGSCNLGLGKFKDAPDLLQRAIEYLLKHSEA